MSDDDIQKIADPRGLEKIETPRGTARSMTTLSPASVQVTYSDGAGQGSDWFGPLQPLRPIAPPEVAGRALDYVPGYNLNTTPRPYEPIDFATLRALANSYDPLRLIIERRKDQVTRLPWTIRVKHDGAKRPRAASLSPATRDAIAEIRRFFAMPDYETPFRSWLRQLIEDLFVIDAPTLYCEREPSGRLIGLRVIDGATIKRVIDDWGRTPRPIAWDGSPLMWCGQLVTIENHQSIGFKMIGGLLYPPAFQQCLHGMPAVDYTTWDILQRPHNLRPGRIYGFSPVEQCLTTINIAMRRAHHQLEYFREGNTPEALYSLPDSWTPQQVRSFQDYWDNIFSGNLAQRRRMKFLAGGSKNSYVPIKEPPLKNEFDEWLVRIVCFAFSYPPTAFMTLSNRSIAEQHEKTAEEEGLEPVKQWACELFNEVIARDFGEPDLEFAWIEEDEVDQKTQAEILTGYAKAGVLSLNEVRERLGEEPDPDPAANQLMIATQTGYVPISGANKENEL
jgi:hypothetical protein